jgi:hypothetical protein
MPNETALGRIGGKLLADNLLRDGRDLVFDNDLLYLKVSPEVTKIVNAPNMEIGARYQIRTIGTTDFRLYGATSNTIGLKFTAGAVGVGDGTLFLIDKDQAIDFNPTSGPGTSIGINTDAPIYDLDVNSEIKSTDVNITGNIIIDNLSMSAPTLVSTTVGPISISPTGSGATAIFDRLGTTDNLLNPKIIFDDNVISTVNNENILFDPNGTGTIELQASTNVTGNLRVTGNINISGNLSKQGNLILGDDIIDAEGNLPENDTVDFNVPFSQSLIPGDDLAYDLGGSLGDSTAGRWADVHVPDWTTLDEINPESAIISSQMLLGGPNNQISAIQSNEDLILSPDTGIVYIERTKWENNDITNLDNTPLRLSAVGRGYYRFGGNNAMVIPFGDTLTRPTSPIVGDTRYNSDLGYLEVFDGTVYVISTGASEFATQQEVNDLGNIYTLILG